MSLSNIYVIWLLIELIFLFFLLVVVSDEIKSVGLIIYFFFQRVISLLLFVRIIIFFDKLVFLLLCGKLGLFPFFYWIVVVRVKITITGNIFVLSLQKISVFWLLWLIIGVSLRFLYFFVYMRIFFVIVNLLIISDLWLLIVYSSIANTGIIMIRLYGSNYIFIVILYLGVILRIIVLIKSLDSYIELILLVFFFLVVPPFLLFFMKFYVILRMDFIIKVGFFLALFDVLVLLYYFSLVFMKFILIDLGVLIYIMNLFLIVLILLLRNCVAMIIFYKS